MSVLYHGGVPDLKPGDTIEPGHSRDNYDDCPICRARREKGASAIEGTGHPEQVYCTRYRDYAALYASMYGKGDVYQVRPVGGVEDSDEDFDGCYRCDRLVVVRAVERHVTLTPKRRRKVIRLMQRMSDGPCINLLPRNATPEMVERYAARESADMRYIMRETATSIAEQEARQTYPAEYQYDSREAYMRGRAAPPTNAEIEAVAKRRSACTSPLSSYSPSVKEQS